MQNIPIHSFLIDDESSVPFQLVQLTEEGSYDTSVPHRHNYYEVFIFEVGGGEHHIDFDTFPIQNNSIHFVSPGQVHNVVRKADSKGFVLLFSRDFYSSDNVRLNQFPFLNNNLNEPLLKLNQTQFELLNKLVNIIGIEQNSRDSLSKDLIKSHLNSFLIYCKRFFNESDRTINFTNDSLSFRFKKLIETNYLKMHNVSEYASILNVSKKQLYESTKNEIGVPPKNLIYDRIILEAKRLVLYTNHSFQEIAFFLNYSDASHFTKFFKSKTGFSPTDFRDQK